MSSPLLEVYQNLQHHAQPCLFVLLFSFLLLLLHFNRKPKYNLPPGPPRLPIIGNLHQLGGLPHHSLRRLSDVYGPIMLLQLGRVPALVVSSAAMAKEILKTHDITFCSRPALTTWQKLSYGGRDLAFAPFSEYWVQMRKVTTVEFFSSKKVQLLRPVREEEVSALVRNIAQVSERGAGVAINLSEMFLSLLSNVTCRAVFGKRFSVEGESRKRDLEELVKATMELIGAFVAGDFYPSMRHFLNVVTGVQRRLEKYFRQMDGFLEREVEERERHVAGAGAGGTDLASVLIRIQKDGNLELPLTRDHIKAILMVTFIAGSDTAATSLIWAMTELIRHPDALYKAQDEVRRAAGGKDMVEESDLPGLKYLSSVVKETMRLHPTGPLLVPRESREDCQVAGYLIPARTMCYVNVWAIGRDPNTWNNPEDFLPERFEDSDVDFKGQHFELLPFGGGRRMCPGLPMGTAVLELALANVLYHFNWALPQGMTREDVDMTESLGMAVHKKVPLELVATPYN